MAPAHPTPATLPAPTSLLRSALPGIAVAVDEGGGKQEVQVLVDCRYWDSAWKRKTALRAAALQFLSAKLTRGSEGAQTREE